MTVKVPKKRDRGKKFTEWLQPENTVCTIPPEMIAPNMNIAARTLRMRLPRMCVAVASKDAAEMAERAEGLVRENSLLEFRLDYLSNPLSALPRLRRLFESRPDIIAIANCRRTAGGGKFRGSLAAQIDILKKAAAAGFQMIDVELQSAEAMRAAEFKKLRDQSAVILSYHDFKSTRRLDDVFERMTAFPADFYKVVTTATSLHDNVTIMRFLQSTRDTHSVIGICMGEQGLISRILALRAGSVFTFASTGAGEETAPGQFRFREMRELYRIEQVDAVTKVFGVAGNPVSHSLSPLLFNTAFRRENVNGVYLALHAKKLDDLLACVRDIPLAGISVTMPYKQEILKHLDNSDQQTQQTGACNTVVRGQDGRLFGFNTDVYGIVATLEQRLPLGNSRILVVGAGGAARAAIFGLRARGAHVFVVNRTPTTAAVLARKAGAEYLKRTDVAKLQFDVIINATPLGMGLNRSTPLEEKELNARYVFDLVYNPLETRLLRTARMKGLHVISGAEMFVQQAARQFEIWTGKPAPLESMRQVLMRQLGIRAAADAVNNPLPPISIRVPDLPLARKPAAEHEVRKAKPKTNPKPASRRPAASSRKTKKKAGKRKR